MSRCVFCAWHIPMVCANCTWVPWSFHWSVTEAVLACTIHQLTVCFDSEEEKKEDEKPAADETATKEDDNAKEAGELVRNWGSIKKFFLYRLTLSSPASLSVYNRANWLRNSASFFVIGFCSLFSLFVGLDRAQNTKGIQIHMNN